MSNKVKRRGGFGILLTWFLLLAFAFGGLMFYYDESPREVWRRVSDSVGRQEVRPAPVPVVDPTPVLEPVQETLVLEEPEPVAAAVPEPVQDVAAAPEVISEPEVVAEPVPAVTPQPVDAVAWLASNKSCWPREVVLQEEVEFAVMHDDKIVGSVKVPAASKLPVIEIKSDEVVVEHMQKKRRLPHKVTNLASLAEGSMAKAGGELSQPPPQEPMTRVVPKPIPTPVASSRQTKGLDAWTASAQMIPGINIGNTFDSTGAWETGWGNPVVTRDYVRNLARLGFKSVRLPVAWDTYADEGKITRQQFERIEEVVDWILDAGMFCVLNIHWDGGWINSASQERFPETHHTFSPEAEKKFPSYWNQIAHRFEDKSEKLIFEGFNEESNFENEGSIENAYETLNKVNQIFVDTVRQTGGNNAHRLLVIPGYTTDIDKTCQKEFRLPKDIVPGKLFISVHYYAPWPFVGLSEDASYAKMETTWGSKEDVKQLNELFDRMEDFCKRRDVPAYIGEFSLCSEKEAESTIRWTTAVFNAAVKRKMVPVLWDTGGAISRIEPYKPTEETVEVLRNLESSVAESATALK